MDQAQNPPSDNPTPEMNPAVGTVGNPGDDMMDVDPSSAAGVPPSVPDAAPAESSGGGAPMAATTGAVRYPVVANMAAPPSHPTDEAAAIHNDHILPAVTNAAVSAPPVDHPAELGRPTSFELDANLMSHESEDAIVASAAGLLNDVVVVDEHNIHVGVGVGMDAATSVMAAAHPHHHPHQDMALEEELFESTMHTLASMEEDDGEGVDINVESKGVGVAAASGLAAEHDQHNQQQQQQQQVVPQPQPVFATATVAPAPVVPAQNTQAPEPVTKPAAAPKPAPSSLSPKNPVPAPQPPIAAPPATLAPPIKVKPIIHAPTHPQPSPRPSPRISAAQSETTRQRAILTNTYSPYIQPTDTSLSDARRRLYTALEQTRLLRAAFTENAYEKYRVILRPVPGSVEEIVDAIQSDPRRAMETLALTKEALRREKEREKKEGMQLPGTGKDDFDQVSFFGSGLNLVVLPEHPVEGSEVDFVKYPQRGPTDPLTGQRYDGITSAAAASAEAVFDRVRRCNAIRMDKDRRRVHDVGGEGGLPVHPYGASLAENLGADLRRSPDVISPALSVDSATGMARRGLTVGKMMMQQQQQQSQQASQKSLLSLSPDAESTRPDGKLTAVQAALISRGVGLNEMGVDPRLKSLQRHQNLAHLDPRYGLPVTASLLPPLLGVDQINRVKGVDVRDQQSGLGARGAIQTVVNQICNIADSKALGVERVLPSSEAQQVPCDVDVPQEASVDETGKEISTEKVEKQQSAAGASAVTDGPSGKGPVTSRAVGETGQAEGPSKTVVEEGSVKKDSSVEAQTSRLPFTLPLHPDGLTDEITDLIVQGKFHMASKLGKEKSVDVEHLCVDFLMSLGSAIPIPKALMTKLLSEGLNMKRYQKKLRPFIGHDNAASTARDVIIASIKAWIWNEYEETFQKATLTNGRIDTDQDCVWLLKISISKSLAALSHVFKKGDTFKNHAPKREIADIVSQSLAKKVVIDSNMSSSLPMVGNLVTLLDSLRVEALKAKTQERVLLAALMSRKGNMSDSFSDAYVSSVIRAGEALGHEEVCEIVQNEECRASTMLPYDFFCDSKGVWEEPCRPPTGYYPGITGDELTKRAHARAAIQKSMKTLQTRLGLRGGVPDGGPYCPVTPSTTPAASPTAANAPTLASLSRSSSASFKRKGSQLFGDTPMNVGTGSAGLPDALFNPGHFSAPMAWDLDSSSNLPYGRHNQGYRPSIVSVGGPIFLDNKRRKISHPADGVAAEGNGSTQEYRSTQEVEWGDVAKMFLQGGSRRNIFGKPGDLGTAQRKDKKVIIAPFIREFDFQSFKESHGEEEHGSSDEDISDETVLMRHQEVLDGMKRKLDAALEKRQQQPPPPRTRKK